jgi:enoyl-CoA hydratase/carnithine racemase
VSTSDVLFTTVGPVAWLTFDRPEAGNAMTWAMYDALAEACDRVDADDGIRVFVLRAAGDAFGTGTDIRQFADFSTGDDGLAYERRLEAVLDRLERVAVPTIAQVQGVAAGAGCAIALACDLRVCTPAARFGVPIARTLGNGLSAANCSRLIDHLGVTRTKDLLFTGRLLDGQEAVDAGLVTQLVEPAEVDDVVRDLAGTIAANASLTMRTVKETLRRLAAHRRLDAGAVDDLIASCYASEDFREGVEAFLSRRTPKFTGR